MSDDLQQVTIFQSLGTRLPWIPSKKNENDYRKYTTAADSTLRTDPPAGWRRSEPGALIRCIEPLPSRNTLQPNDRFLKFAPFDDECGYLASEGDVFAATILHVVNPVNHAMKRHIRGGLALTMSCEHASGRTSRTDIRWTLHVPTSRRGVTEARILAILELKAKDTLHLDEFEVAMATSDDGERQKDRDARNPSKTRNIGTLFHGNSLLLMKQVTKYSEELNVPDIAIFDWNNMFILDYSTWDRSSGHPKFPKGIWMNESSRTNYQVGHLYTFRATLYGFLLRALERYVH